MFVLFYLTTILGVHIKGNLLFLAINSWVMETFFNVNIIYFKGTSIKTKIGCRLNKIDWWAWSSSLILNPVQVSHHLLQLFQNILLVLQLMKK